MQWKSCSESLTALAMLMSMAVISHPAKAQMDIATAEPASISSGWVGHGQSVTIKTKVKSNLNIQNVNVGYSIFNVATGTWLTSQSVNYPNLSAGQEVIADHNFQIPTTAAAGQYRVVLEFINNWPFANQAQIWSDQQAGCFTVSVAQPANYGIATRGCSDLPNGPYKAVGNQIVDGTGTPLRIAAANWAGTNGPARSASEGLSELNYKEFLKSVKQAGFNAVRIPYSDASLYTRAKSYWELPSYGAIDPQEKINGICVGPVNNSELWEAGYPQPDSNCHYTFLTTFDIFKKYVAYAKQLGLKVIFDHHSSEGNGGQQRNGLWFSKDPALNYSSDGSDDTNANGFITYDTFKANLVALATEYANEPTVIGFELHNEPLLLDACGSGQYQECQPVQLNWGVTNNKYDMKFMAQDVGNAILAVNPNALIILEAPFSYFLPSTNTGMASILAIDGNLTAVAGFGSTPPNPIVLNQPNRMVYSIHEYPLEIAWPNNPMVANDGIGYINRMNEAWAHVAAQNIAPVLITEFGGFFPDPPGTPSAGARNWMATLLPFLNGKSGHLNGPASLYGNQQPLGTFWYAAGIGEQQCCQPNGNQNSYGTDEASFLQEARGYIDAVRYKSLIEVTPNHTVIGIGASIKDVNGNVWSIQGGKVTVNGAADNSASNITQLAYVSNKVYRRKATGQWSFKTLPSNSWSADTTASPLTASPASAIAMPGSAPLIDAAGNFWAIAGGKILVNGVLDTTTANVQMLAYSGGKIWQKNAAGLWWSKTAPSASWLPLNGQTAAPALTTSVARKAIAGSDGWIIDANKHSWMLINGQIMVNGVADSSSMGVIELTYVGGKIWKKNSNGTWQSKTLPTNAWSAATANAPARATNANNTTVLPGGNGIIDANNIAWVLSNGQVVIDGVRDATTSNVVAIAYSAGKVWQKNASGLWWSKGGLFDVWTPTNGTSTPPF